MNQFLPTVPVFTGMRPNSWYPPHAPPACSDSCRTNHLFVPFSNLKDAPELVIGRRFSTLVAY